MIEALWQVDTEAFDLDYTEVLRGLGFSVIERLKKQFELNAVTDVYILAESHFIVHTYPERNLVHYNLFSCKDEHTAEMMARFVEEISAFAIGTILSVCLVTR